MKTQCWVKIKLTIMELSGKVISVTENTRVKQDGVREWFRYDVLINYEQGDYTKNAAISFSGKKFENVLKLEGREARIYFDVSGQIYNGKPQNILKGYKYDVR